MSSGIDSVLPFRLEALGVRGRVIRLGPLLDAVLARHVYPLLVGELLAEAMVLAAGLASGLKYDGIFTLQIRGDGPVRLLVTDITSDGAVRGYAQFDATRLDQVAAAHATPGVPHLCGSGTMAFTVDQGPDTERYQGVVDLEGATLADCAHHYFRMSEQIRSGIKIAVRRTAGESGARWRAAAIMLQQLPSRELVAELDADEREEGWRKSMVLLGSARNEEMLDEALAVETLLYRLFHEDGVHVFRPRRLDDRCRCSRERVDSVLRSIPRGELAEMKEAESGQVVVTCEFCARKYSYSDADLSVLDSQAPVPG